MSKAGTTWRLRGQRILIAGAHEPQPATLTIDGEVISAIRVGEDSTPLDLTRDVDAGERVVMAGIVDTHAHINEPGRTEWEGFETATRAAAAGGITTVVDMPLNSIPPTTSLSGLEAKAGAAEGRCLIDYGFWGGVVPDNAGELNAMIERGALGFKAFMIESGVDEFRFAQEKDLRLAMPILARAGVPLLVHAEVDLGATPSQSDPKNYSRYVQSRPPRWEVEAIRRIIRLSAETGCAVHIVHLSAAAALADLKRARAQGVPITVETCPHYLTFCEEEIAEGATHFKCAPPIRDRANQDWLWQGLRDGVIDFIVSDHSPCTPALKKLETGNFDQAWGGIAGLQFSMPAVWTQMRRRGLALRDLTRWMSVKTARFAGLDQHKGRIQVGLDADFVIWDPDATFQVEASQVRHRHSLTPYAGQTLHGVVHQTYRRGERIYDHGQFPTQARGQWQRRPTSITHTRSSNTMSLPLSPPSAESVYVPFTEYPDLLDERMGGRALATNDDFFAPMSNLVKHDPAVWIAGKYTEFGKWMDGWESRRKRNLGPGNDHDWCVLALGVAGRIRGVDVDTSYFTGNYPEFCALDVAHAEKGPWREVIGRTRLKGGSHNYIAVADTESASHVRLRIFPDGGVARLRVYGEPRPQWKPSELVDLAAITNGAQVVTCNDMFFGSKDNLIMPGRAATMGEGWETKRRRGPGHDWIIVRLAAPGTITKIEVDTNHFKGNFPESCSIEGCLGEPGLTATDVRDRSDIQWKEILPRTKLQAHTQHYFETELARAQGQSKWQYVRLNIYPDGGVSRLRVWGRP